MTQGTRPCLNDYLLDAQIRERLLSPALVVYMDQVRHNIATILTHLGGDPERWRPHVKTLKIPEVQAQLARAGVRNFKCATPREADCLAQVLVDEGINKADILLAYPLLGPGMARLAQVAESHPQIQFSVLVETPRAAETAPSHLDLFVDINAGMNRTGIHQESFEQVRCVARAAGARLRGLHAYDGHRHEPDLTQRAQALKASYTQLAELAQRLQGEGLAIGEIVTAGTPAFLHASQTTAFASLPDIIHRVSPGTVVLHDLRSAEENPDLDLHPAALLFTRVISHPAEALVTCDAGSKSLAAEAGDPCAEVLGHVNLQAQSPSEEHLPLAVLVGPKPERGSELLLIPRHVCPTVNLAEQALLVEPGKQARAVPVVARAHDLLLGKVSSANMR